MAELYLGGTGTMLRRAILASGALVAMGIHGQGAARAASATNETCIADQGGDFKTIGGRALFVVKLKNSCAKRFRCVVNYNIVSAFGSDVGRVVIPIRPRTKGGPSEASRAIPVKAASGSAELARSCGASH